MMLLNSTRMYWFNNYLLINRKFNKPIKNYNYV